MCVCVCVCVEGALAWTVVVSRDQSSLAATCLLAHSLAWHHPSGTPQASSKGITTTLLSMHRKVASAQAVNLEPRHASWAVVSFASSQQCTFCHKASDIQTQHLSL